MEDIGQENEEAEEQSSKVSMRNFGLKAVEQEARKTYELNGSEVKESKTQNIWGKRTERKQTRYREIS